MPDYRGSKIISNKGRSLKRARKGELLPAVTEYRVLTESPYGVSLVECKPITGYKHQVRYDRTTSRKIGDSTACATTSEMSVLFISF